MKNTKKMRRVIISGLAAYLATILVVATAGSAAAFRSNHSSMCHYGYDDAGSGLYNGQYLLNNTGSTKTVWCPAINDDQQSLNGAVLYLDVYESTNGAYTKACSASFGSGAVTCGSATYWSTGAGYIYPSTSAWNSYSNYGYLYNNVTNGSRIYGYATF